MSSTKAEGTISSELFSSTVFYVDSSKDRFSDARVTTKLPSGILSTGTSAVCYSVFVSMGEFGSFRCGFRLSVSTFMYQVMLHGLPRPWFPMYVSNESRRNITFRGRNFHSHLLYFFCNNFTRCHPSTFTLHFKASNGFHRLVIVLQIIRLTRNTCTSEHFLMNHRRGRPTLISSMFLQVIRMIRVIQLRFPVLLGPVLIRQFRRFLITQLMKGSHCIHFLACFPHLLRPLRRTLFYRRALPLISNAPGIINYFPTRTVSNATCIVTHFPGKDHRPSAFLKGTRRVTPTIKVLHVINCRSINFRVLRCITCQKI